MAEATNDLGEASTTESASATASTTEPGLMGMLIKDLAVIFAAVSLWAAADTWYVVTGMWLAQIVAVGDAILVGLLLASLFHEWGHYAGAVYGKSEVCRVTPKGLSLFRFKFDYDANDHQQFHWMTYGGHIFHWAILLIIFIALPMDSLGRISLVGALVGFIAFATFFEYNVLKDTWAGVDPGERLNAVTPKDFQQAAAIGGLAGLFAIAGLA
jgi:hypothetical protein